jgi:hypothetical protein
VAGDEVAWVVEASKDGDHWRFFGKLWTKPGEPALLHGAPRLVRFRPHGPDTAWSAGLERTGDHPMSLLSFEPPGREDLWPDERHTGLPVLLPGGEEGRLLRFDHTPDGRRWTWAVEFRGLRHP